MPTPQVRARRRRGARQVRAGAGVRPTHAVIPSFGGTVVGTAARHDCPGTDTDTERTSWCNHVDVDVIGEIDT